MRHKQSEILTVREAEAASLLNVSQSCLRAWRSQGRGPSYCRLSRRIVYPVTDLEAYLSRNRVSPTSE